MNKSTQLKTPQQVRDEFAAAGVTQAEWARANGFHRLVVVGLLRGANLGRWGESHRCAVALGLKAGEVVALNQFKPAPQRRSQDSHTGVTA